MKSTGEIVLFGKEQEDDPAAFHFYKNEKELQKVGTKSAPCRHNSLFILPVVIKGNERLLVSCWQCRIIWFYNFDTGKFSIALKKEGFDPEQMCKAEGDYVYIVTHVKGPKPILKLKCTPTKLIVDKFINCKMDNFSSMCYLSDVKCLAISNKSEQIVKAIHCETSEEIWKVKREITGVTWKPHGLFYCPENQSLIVCDDGRLMILNPKDGNVQRVLPVPNFGRPISMSLHDGDLNMYSKKTNDTKIYVFTINCL